MSAPVTTNSEELKTDPERYWNRAGEVSYSEAMFADSSVERHVNLRLWGTAAAIADQLGVPKEGRVLDLGCGDGAFANHALRDYARVDGYDLAPAAIERARATAPGPNYHYDTADLIAFDYAALPRYDGVFMIGILHHIKQAAPEIVAKIAALSDSVIVLEPNGDNIMRKALELTPAYKKAGEDSFRTKDLRAMFERAGYTTVVERRMNLFPNFTPGFLFKALSPLEAHVESNPVLRACCTVNMMGFSKTNAPRP
ncbi:MAG: class I SAM-dependent methyltransferase [Hyphomonadaceae bacterium]